MKSDLVIRGGRIFTSVPSRLFLDAVAVTGDRISAVGEEALETIGPDTRIIELDGALATPGFIDAHVHPAMSGLDLLRCSLEDCRDGAEAVARIAEYAAANPGVPWIIGSGWRQSWFPRGCPSKELIDQVVADRPVLIDNTDGHGSWANSRALEIAGVDASTPDPPDGRIERNEDGSPQGTLHEGAIKLVSRHAPEDTVDDFVAGLIRGQQEMLRYGITGWQDAIVREPLHDAYLRVAGDGRLTGRVVGAMWWKRGTGVEQIDELVERRRASAPGFEPRAIKLMLDGVMENFTASLLEPYLDANGEATDNTGIDFIDPVELREIVTRLDSLGFQCHFHAIGDGAVRSALDAVEAAARVNGPSGNRHHIAHIQLIHPDDVPRFGALGVAANAQPLWACNDDYQDELTKPFLGPVRSDWQYPFKSLQDGGAHMGMGSDWGVSTCNVMEEIDVAITRSVDGGTPLVPSEAMAGEDSLIAFTAGSAYINHADDVCGSIGVGMLADLAVLDRDPFRDGPFREAKVVTTIIGGEVVYEGV